MKKKGLLLGILFSTLLLLLPIKDTVFAATYNSQNVTAYVAPLGNKTYHGTTPQIYVMAAVRPAKCGDISSGTKLPKGTIITTSTKLDSFPDSVSRDSFAVYDMGDTNCVRDVTPYFFDIYFGIDTKSNYEHAKYFGKKTVNYSTFAWGELEILE
ncbi:MULTISPECIES: hypothetical protein [Lysinibacillus]|uniref:hypothetical protein n=1 Tax=Lysinibacillus TaxID=400634 RepID=UPI00083CA3B0|nr:hypothetical protein [Lysinibacillus xylanilyticus]